MTVKLYLIYLYKYQNYYLHTFKLNLFNLIAKLNHKLKQSKVIMVTCNFRQHLKLWFYTNATWKRVSIETLF